MNVHVIIISSLCVGSNDMIVLSWLVQAQPPDQVGFVRFSLLKFILPTSRRTPFDYSLALERYEKDLNSQ